MHKLEKLFQILLVTSIAATIVFFLIIKPAYTFINDHNSKWDTAEIDRGEKRPIEFIVTDSSFDKDDIIYKNWDVRKYDDMIMYSTHGTNVHGHRFGWAKKSGHCDSNNLYLTISTTHEDKDILENFKNSRIALKFSYPEVEGVTYKTVAEIIAVNDFGSMKIVFLNIQDENPTFNLYAEKLRQIKVEIEPPFKSIFDIPEEIWNLDGLIASKLKAREMCKSAENTHSLI